jgi:hypothetical protein
MMEPKDINSPQISHSLKKKIDQVKCVIVYHLPSGLSSAHQIRRHSGTIIFSFVRVWELVYL